MSASHSRIRALLKNLIPLLTLVTPVNALAEKAILEATLEQAEKEFAKGEFSSAEKHFTSAEDTARSEFGDASLELANALNLHAGALCGRKQFTEAIKRYEEAVDIRKSKLGQKHRDYAVVLNNLGFCQLQAEDNSNALLNLNTARASLEASGSSEPILLSLVSGNLGEAYYRSGKQAEAEKQFVRAIELLKGQVGADDLMLGTAFNNLAYVESAMGKYQLAIPLYESALKIMEHHYGPNHPQVANALHNLSEATKEAGNGKRASALLDRAVRIREKEKAPELPVSLHSKAEEFLATERPKDAIPLLQKAIALTESQSGNNVDEITPLLDSLGLAYLGAGQYREAEGIYRRLVKHGPPSAKNNLAFSLLKQKKHQEAEAIYLELLNSLEDKPEENIPERARILRDMSQLRRASGDSENALRYLVRAAKLLMNGNPGSEAEIVRYLQEISELQESRGSIEDAKKTARSAYKLAEASYGPEAKETKELAKRLASLGSQ